LVESDEGKELHEFEAVRWVEVDNGGRKVLRREVLE
jgi:hypothetical protein